MSAIDAVIFDLDGTLVDNMEFHVEAWLSLAQDLGVELTRARVLEEFSGRPNADIFPRVLGRPVIDEELANLEERKESLYRQLYAPHLSYVAGAEALLSHLTGHGIGCALASSAPAANRNFVLDGLDMRGRFAAVVGVEEVARGKPAPDMFLEAARRLGAAAPRVLVFEDARSGVQAARAAGMYACGITTSEPSAALMAEGAQGTASDFTKLPVDIASLLPS